MRYKRKTAVTMTVSNVYIQRCSAGISTKGSGESEVTFYSEILCASLNTSPPDLINMTEEKMHCNFPKK